MALAPGTRLGPYELGAQIGMGGMGVVYRATDTNLKRAVAIKVLPDAVASDGERLARFRREAEVLASLNHPNIAAIYGLERTDTTTALVLELVEGPTLADRIEQGPIAVDEALWIARQIAEALESAHEQRIIHRDLKPANIKLRLDGTVKVLDFGLAKALEPTPNVSASLSHSSTITMAMTQPGVIFGTAAYMAPEQARGAALDQRADIWAFGCVLYEMLAGRTAFGAATVSETLARILEGRPDLDALPSSTPVEIRRLVRRCLERPVRTRLQHIGDALADIVDVRDGESSLAGHTATRSAPRGRAIIWAAASVGLVTLGAAVAWLLSSQLAPAATAAVPIRFDVQRVQMEAAGVATRQLALSPDGTRLAYATVSSLRLRAMGGEDVPLPETGNEPFFSPDNKWLAFFSAEGLKRLPVGGGASEPITPATGTERVFGGTWGTDGTIVISLGGRLLQVSATGGPIQPVAEPDPTRGEVRFAWPEFLPDGRSVLFTIIGEAGAADARVAVLDLATRHTTNVLQGGHAARYLRTGHLLYTSQGRLHIVAFDVRALRTRGAPVTLENMNIATTPGGFNANFAVSDNGTLAYLPPVGPRIKTLVWVDRNGAEEAIPAPPMEYVYPRISPDGTRVALDVLDVRGRNRDIWVGNLASGVVTKITDGPTEDLMPAWSPDGTRVFFASDREGGTFRVFSVAADGAGAERQEFAGKGNFMPLSMPSPDQLITAASGEGTREGDIAIVTIGGSAQPPKVFAMERVQGNAQVSPDGRWIAYQSAESGTHEVYVRSYPDVDRRREQISIDGGLQPLWGRRGSNDLFYWDLKGKLKVVSVATTADLHVGPSRDVTIAEGVDRPIANSAWVYAVSPVDGRLLMFKPVSSSGALVPFKVIVNWFEELKRLGPTE